MAERRTGWGGTWTAVALAVLTTLPTVDGGPRCRAVARDGARRDLLAPPSDCRTERLPVGVVPPPLRRRV